MGIRSGIDMIEIERIKKVLDKSPEAFLCRVYTTKEIDYCEGRKMGRLQSYAARFSAKEAVSKALGTGISKGISFQDIEIVNDSTGKPLVKLYGQALKVYESIKGKTIDVSLTHCHDYAAAYAVIETES